MESVDLTLAVALDGDHLLHGIVHLDTEAMAVDTALTQGLAEVVQTFELLLYL